MFGGIERTYMYDENDRNIFLDRFIPILDLIIFEFCKEKYTIDVLIEYYNSLRILHGLELIRRYNYRIEISDDDLEDKKKYEKETEGESEGELEEELEGESERESERESEEESERELGESERELEGELEERLEMKSKEKK